MGGHSKGAKVKPNFCTLRKEGDCGCGNDYTAIIKKDEQWAHTDKYAQIVRIKGKKTTQFWSANAHHILCVAEVTKVISKDRKLRIVTTQSKWCINAQGNMAFLPLFSNTVTWYYFCAKDGPPKFKNLPNHNFDHGPYNKEVEGEMNKLKAQIKEALHDYEPSKLASTLRRKSKAFRTLLKDRGIRGDGTHGNWVKAEEGDDEKWYEPFSMAANADASKLAFPGSFQEKRNKTYDRLLKALLNIK